MIALFLLRARSWSKGELWCGRVVGEGRVWWWWTWYHFDHKFDEAINVENMKAIINTHASAMRSHGRDACTVCPGIIGLYIHSIVRSFVRSLSRQPAPACELKWIELSTCSSEWNKKVFRLTVDLFFVVASSWMLFLRVKSGMRPDQLTMMVFLFSRHFFPLSHFYHLYHSFSSLCHRT